jgi:hypothetical protein
MLTSARRLVPAVLVVAAFAPPLAAASPYDELLKSVSPNTNTLVLVNAKAAYDSPLGREQKWADRAKTSAHGALGFVPANAEAVVIASEVNFSSLVRDFQVGLMRLRGNVPNMNALAKSEAGTVDEMAGRLVVRSQRGAYFTSLGGQALAVAFPADRQYTARWLRQAAKADGPSLAPYLQKAAANAGDAVVVVALDLDEAVDAGVLRGRLAHSPTILRWKGVDTGVLAKFIAKVKGMTFTAAVADSITGTATVEFGADPNPFKGMVHSLFLELLADQGVAFPGVDQWKVTYTANSMTLTGPMTPQDLQRVLSLFAFPGSGPSEADGKADEPSVIPSKHYYEALNVILRNLSGMRDSKDYDKTATWHEKAVAQIEQLSHRGVDPAAVQAGAEVAARLRGIALSLRGVPIDLDKLSAQSYAYVYGAVPAFGWWGGGNVNVQTNVPEMQAKMAKTIADDQKKRVDAWSQIERVMSEARRTLSEKFMTPF